MNAIAWTFFIAALVLGVALVIMTVLLSYWTGRCLSAEEKIDKFLELIDSKEDQNEAN